MIVYLIVNSANETISEHATAEEAESALHYADDDCRIAAVVLPARLDCRERDELRAQDNARAIAEPPPQ